MWLALARVAIGGEIVTTEVGGNDRTGVQDWAYKLDVYAVEQTVRVVSVSPWLDFTPGTYGGDGVVFAVYAETDPDRWALAWQSPLEPTGPDAGFKDSPEPAPDLLLEAGRRYAIGVVFDEGNYTYAYDQRTEGDVGWASQIGAIFVGEDSFSAVPTDLDQTPSADLAYWQRVTVEILDGDGDGVITELDCDDADPLNYPGGLERCDGRDNDCTGAADDPVDDVPWYRDVDRDGYGDEADVVTTCDGSRPPGRIPTGGDCDDRSNAVHPGVDEYCDGEDEDCSGVADDDPVTAEAYQDLDLDGFGGEPVEYCTRERPAELVLEGGDCDDGDALAFPGAPEACDGADDDCDGAADDGLPVYALYADADQDGFGDPATARTWCEPALAGFVDVARDCDDADAGTFPRAPEVCDGVDNNCDGLAGGEGDADGDGALDCADCAADDPEIFPGALEVCDGVDHDCDGVAKDRLDCDPAPDEAITTASCGCRVGGDAGAPAAVSWVAVAAAVAARRRKVANAAPMR